MSGVDNSAVARVVGITTQFVDLRGGNVLFLPQRIAVFAQGASASVYATDKYPVTSVGAAGAKFGYGSPIHLILRELMPQDGRPGVGTIPVTVYPLSDAPSSAAAVGSVVPSGTPTVAGSYRLRIGGIKTPAFVIAAGALATAANLTAACKAMGDAAAAVLELPVIPTYTYGTVTSVHTTVIGGSNGTLGVFTTTGNPVPGVWTLLCTATATNAGTFKLTDPNGTVVSTTVTIGAQVQGGLGFTLADGSTDFGVGDLFTITVPATNFTGTSKWKGASANGLLIEIIPESDSGVTFAITQPTGGLVNPDVTTALALMGNVWETLCLNAANIDDTTTLDAFMNFGEGRWGTNTHQPLTVWTGNTIADPTAATAVSNARRTDRVNGQLVNPGSKTLPFISAARQLVPIAVTANNSPPQNYTARPATGLLSGTDGQQWDQPTRDFAVKRGSSTIELVDSVVQLSDVMMFYRPTGEEPPAYRYLVDIVKEANVIFNVALIFASVRWAGAPLVPDNQAVDLPEAKKPKMAKAEVSGLFDSLGRNAILSDPDTAKKTIFCGIDAQNPKRMNVRWTTQVSGNSQIINVENNWGFFYGSAA